jgi:PST family polysaccharide transporter
MILAALLTPSDFGIVAISTLVLAFAKILVDMGLGKAIVQRQTHIDDAASLSLLFSLVISIGIYCILWVTSPWISIAYNDDRVVMVIRVAALYLPLSALAATPKALLQRNLEFNHLFWVHSSFIIIQSIASVALAFAGINYWALIWGQLIGMIVSTGLAWILVRWKPKISINWTILRSMLSFSSWILVSGLLTWLFLYADNVIAGLFLGINELGKYSLGFSISTLIPGFLVASFGDVAYPAFCRLQGSPKEVGQILLKLQNLIVAILFPVVFGISAIAPIAIHLLYGDKWQGLGSVIRFLVIMPGLGYIWSLNEKAYQAIGRPDFYTKLSGITLLLLIPLLWIAAPHGLMTFTFVRFSIAVVLPAANIVYGTRILGIGLKEQITTFGPILFITLIMFSTVLISIEIMNPYHGFLGWVKLIGIVLIGMFVYVLLLRFTKRDLLDQILKYFLQVIT